MRQVLSFERVTPEPGPDADATTHEYVARVTLPGGAGDAGSPLALEVGGVATVHDVLVDGVVVASGRSMFESHRIDLAEALGGPPVAGKHEVRIVVHPLTGLLEEMPRRPRARWRTQLTDEARLRWVRTSILGRAPGFAPGPPVVGPHRPVVLTDEWPAPRLRPRVVGSAGVLDVEAVDGGPAPAVELTRDGVVVASGAGPLTVPDVDLWWPHTHGRPACYEVRVAGSTVVRRVGFRNVENRSTTGSLDLWINGVRVFVRGAVWTPGDLAALDEAVALGLNLVRVSGVSAYESEEFHARCDELGLLVWQDLMLATFDYPLADPDFAAALRAEVAEQVDRLHGHPSTVVVCGSAEHEQQAAMFGVSPTTGAARELAEVTRPVVRASGLDAVWVDGTPSGGVPVTRVDTGVAQYFGVGAYLRDLPDVRHSRVGFAGECLAFSHLPDLVVPGGVPQDNGADWDFADVRHHYLRRLYGEDLAARAPQGAEAQRVTGEVSADVFGEWRRPDSGCGGGIVLWLRDLEPGAGWGLLDHEGRPKPGALTLAPTLQPTAVWLVDEGLSGLDVHVAHDGPEPLEATLTVEMLRADGSVVESAQTPVSLPGHGHAVHGVEALLGRFADVTHAYRFGEPQAAAVRARLTWTDGDGVDRGRTATWTLGRW